MKKGAFLLILSFLSFHLYAQNSTQNILTLKQTKVDASCGTCQFKLEGNTCLLAIKYKGKAYFVDGTGIDDHGDAHGKNGFCNAVRKAVVSGSIENGRFKSTSFVLKPSKK